MTHPKRAIALGFFDGIHIGHAALLRRLTEVCSNTELKPLVISFDTLPQNLINNKATPLINTMEDRMWLIIKNYRVFDINFLRFDEKMASMPWNNFIDYLINECDAGRLIAGENFRFGKGAEGNSELLRRRCTEKGLGCDIIPDVMLDNTVVSSTYIRELLLAGEIGRANTFLGHQHIFTGVVSKGQKLGKKLGTPTINMSVPPGVLTPKYGVYATKVYPLNDTVNIVFPATGEKKPRHRDYAPHSRLHRLPDYPEGLTGITNIGVRPTVADSDTVTVETHIPGFKENLYGYKARIEFYSYLRSEIKFGTTDELKAQIQKDCASAIEYFTK